MESFFQIAVRILLAQLAARKRFCTILGLSFLLATTPADALDPHRSIAQLHHTGWTMRDGMPGNIHAITQTPDGFLWLGTSDGLYRFDGLRIERIDHFGKTDLPRSDIWTVLTTPDGDLWLGYNGFTPLVSRIHHGEITNFSEKDGLPPGAVGQIIVDTAGVVWARLDGRYVDDSLARFDGKSWRQVKGDFGSRSRDAARGIWSFAAARDGTVWAGNSTTLYYYRDGMEGFEPAPGFTGRILGFFRASDGQVWTGDRATRRLYALPDLSRDTEARVPPSELGAPIPESCTGAILIDKERTAWCNNIRDGGISRLRSAASATSQPNDLFKAVDGLTSNILSAFFEDREGNVWFATTGGLDRFRAAAIAEEPQVPLAFNPLMESTDDAVYVYSGSLYTTTMATNLASIYRIAPGEDPHVVASNVGDVREISSHATDLTYIASPSEGGALAQYTIRNGQNPKKAPVADASLPGVPLEETSFLQQAEDGAIWYARMGVGYFKFQNGRHTLVIDKKDPNVPGMAMKWLDKRLVYYPDGTLYQIEGDHVQVVRVPIANFVSANKRRVLLFSSKTLTEWDGRHLRTQPISSPLSGASSGLLRDNGDFWIMTSAGIIRTTESDLDRILAEPRTQLKYRLFDFRDGLDSALQPGFASIPGSSDDRVWFLTAGGLAWIDASRIPTNHLPPPVAITAFASGGAVYDAAGDLRLPPGSSTVQIDYTALSLSIPERIRFKYRLEGVDQDWVDASDRRQASYTRLEPGTYRFHVIASNNDGVWNEQGAMLTFAIAPTFLQTIWFKILVAAAVAGLLWFAWTVRLRQQTARMQNRFETRIAERERIARELHDTLLQGVQGLVLRFQAIANRAPKNSDLRGSLDEAIDRADSVIAEGRARVRELRSIAETKEIADAIANIARNAISGDKPRFTITVEGTPRNLHTLVAEEAPRIAEEAIRNVVQHADAASIEVVLSYTRSGLLMTIRDDGAGMSEAVLAAGRKEGHFGLVGMQERAQRIGGRLHVASRKGTGTEITLMVPRHTAFIRRTRL